MIKKMLTLSMCLLALILSSATAGAQAPKPVAKVNGTILTEADLEDALNEIMPAGAFHGGFSAEKRNSYRPQAIEKMIEKELFFQEAQNRGLKVDNDKVKEARQNTIDRLGGEDNYKSALKNSMLTDKAYQDRLYKQFLVEKFFEDIRKEAEIPDEAALTHYEANKKRYFRPEAIRLTHIMIQVNPAASEDEKQARRSRAEEALAKIKAGEDISMIAWDYSDDKWRVKGGDMGLIHRGRLDPTLEDAIFKLEPGKVSNLIATRHGFHIARIEKIIPPEELDFEEVAEQIKQSLSDQKENDLKTKLIQSLRAKARIETY